MREISGSSPGVRLARTRLAVAMCVAGVLACSSPCAHGAEGTRSTQAGTTGEARNAPKDIEREFWTCDHAAATRGVFGWETYGCSSNFEELKTAKFGGDFTALLAWWQKNKAAEHRALAEGSAAVVAR